MSQPSMSQSRTDLAFGARLVAGASSKLLFVTTHNISRAIDEAGPIAQALSGLGIDKHRILRKAGLLK